MLDKKRIAVKFVELSLYLGELDQIAPATFKEYLLVEKKRSCERLMQLSIECVMDVCKLLASGLDLGIPGEESSILDSMHKAHIVSRKMYQELKEMKGYRNILVHEYATVDDKLAFEILRTKKNSFLLFKKEVLAFVKDL